MKTMTIAAAALLAASGFAFAAEDESAVTLDLTGADKGLGTYYLKCQYGGRDFRTCGTLSVWENTNGVRGLQTTMSMTGVPRDDPALS